MRHGSSSYRWKKMPRLAHRRLTSQAYEVDLRDLKQRGWSMMLAGGWVGGGDDAVTIEWCGRRLTVALTETQPQFGGKRLWFRCPKCGARARIIYSPRFTCRRCAGLLHPSTRQTGRDRAITRAVRLRRSLGGDGSLLAPFPSRPKGMKRKTWMRLFAKCKRDEQRGIMGMAATVANLSARLIR